jgi:chaperonin GroES
MLKPLADRILVELDESIPSAARFGLILPPKTDAYRARDGAVEGENRGIVVSVGPGRRSSETGECIPLEVKEGDVVRFSELEYPSEAVNGRKHVLISEMDVLWVEEAEDEPGDHPYNIAPLISDSPYSVEA